MCAYAFACTFILHAALEVALPPILLHVHVGLYFCFFKFILHAALEVILPPILLLGRVLVCACTYACTLALILTLLILILILVHVCIWLRMFT